MDEEDIDYFHEDIKKVDKIEHCKLYPIVILISCDGNP
jgi:hypothetical protein